MKFEYYYNNVPGKGLVRNNLIYTSLISEDKKTFCQWYHNDTEYHKGKNEVVDPSKMEEKWQREIKYLTLMTKMYPFLVPEILEIDHTERKLYLKIDGPDLWQRSLDIGGNLYDVVPSWEQQILSILIAHKSLGLYKHSFHPSSFFVIDGQLKSINYFFTYHKSEPNICIKDVESHIYSERQEQMKQHIEKLGIKWDQPEPHGRLQRLCFDSFRTNYPAAFIERAKRVYNND